MTDPLSRIEVQERLINARIEAEQFVPGTRDEDGLQTWWVMSFTDENGFLGGAYVEAPSMPTAVARAHQLGCNPGGQVLALGFRAREVDRAWANRLLTKEEVQLAPEPEGMVILPYTDDERRAVAEMLSPDCWEGLEDLRDQWGGRRE